MAHEVGEFHLSCCKGHFQTQLCLLCFDLSDHHRNLVPHLQCICLTKVVEGFEEYDLEVNSVTDLMVQVCDESNVEEGVDGMRLDP